MKIEPIDEDDRDSGHMCDIVADKVNLLIDAHNREEKPEGEEELCCVAKLGCLCKPDETYAESETCLCPEHYATHDEWLKKMVSHPPKPTACCEKCYEVLQTETTSTNSNSIVKGQQVQCSNTFCPCHQPASKEKICTSHTCHIAGPHSHPGTEEESQAPHETPTKTCTCPHCDNWRCDHKN